MNNDTGTTRRTTRCTRGHTSRYLRSDLGALLRYWCLALAVCGAVLESPVVHAQNNYDKDYILTDATIHQLGFRDLNGKAAVQVITYYRYLYEYLYLSSVSTATTSYRYTTHYTLPNLGPEQLSGTITLEHDQSLDTFDEFITTNDPSPFDPYDMADFIGAMPATIDMTYDENKATWVFCTNVPWIVTQVQIIDSIAHGSSGLTNIRTAGYFERRKRTYALTENLDNPIEVVGEFTIEDDFPEHRAGAICAPITSTVGSGGGVDPFVGTYQDNPLPGIDNLEGIPDFTRGIIIPGRDLGTETSGSAVVLDQWDAGVYIDDSTLAVGDAKTEIGMDGMLGDAVPLGIATTTAPKYEFTMPTYNDTLGDLGVTVDFDQPALQFLVGLYKPLLVAAVSVWIFAWIFRHLRGL